MTSKVKGPPYEIPDGFTDMLQLFVVHVLRNQPDNLLDCATEYFLNLQGIKQPLDSIKVGQGKTNLQGNLNNTKPVDHKEEQLSQAQTLVAASQQTIGITATEAAPEAVNSMSNVVKEGTLHVDRLLIAF